MTQPGWGVTSQLSEAVSQPGAETVAGFVARGTSGAWLGGRPLTLGAALEVFQGRGGEELISKLHDLVEITHRPDATAKCHRQRAETLRH